MVCKSPQSQKRLKALPPWPELTIGWGAVFLPPAKEFIKGKGERKEEEEEEEEEGEEEGEEREEGRTRRRRGGRMGAETSL